MKKKSVLVILDNLRIGGISAINMHLLKTLNDKSRTYEFYLLCGTSDRPEDIYLDDFSFCKKIYTYKRDMKKSHLYAFFETIFNTYKLVSKAYSENKIDFVLLNHPYSAIGAILCGKIKREKTACFFHGASFLEKDMIYEYNQSSNIKSQIKRFLSKILFRFIQAVMLVYADKIICCSQYAKTLLRDSFNINKKVYDLSIPYLDFNINKKTAKKEYKKLCGLDKDALVFLYSSRFEPRKGLHLLPEAIKSLFTKKRVNFIITGPIHHKARDYFQKIYTSLQPPLGNIKIYFVNEIINKSELYKYYLAADAVLMPSVGLETLGMVILESLSLGTPVISLPASAGQEMLSKIDKRLISRDLTPKALAESIKWFCELSAKERTKLNKKTFLYTREDHSLKRTLRDCSKIFN